MASSREMDWVYSCNPVAHMGLGPWSFNGNFNGILMHAVRNGTASTYIRDLVTPVNEISGRSHLRSATLGHFDVPRTRTKLGSRAFSVAGPVA